MKTNLFVLAAILLSGLNASAETLQAKAIRIAKVFAAESGSVYNSHCGALTAATAFTLDRYTSETGIQSFFVPFNTRESNYECSPDYGVDLVFDAQNNLLEARLVNN